MKRAFATDAPSRVMQVSLGTAHHLTSDHRLVELWTRRSFQCDCPTIAMCPSDSSKKHKCTLNPPDKQPQPVNEKNRYTKNFTGAFCRCGRDYDPETEVEAMINCIACEVSYSDARDADSKDWLHESCLNLQPRRTVRVEDDEDEESLCLIPSDTYDGLVCADCVRSSPFIVERAGTESWMVIEPGPEGQFDVIGKVTEAVSAGAKRERPVEEQESKKVRLEDGTAGVVGAEKETGEQGEDISRKTEPAERKGLGDVFLAHGIRDRLAKELDVGACSRDVQLTLGSDYILAAVPRD